MTTADTLLLRCRDAARIHGNGPVPLAAVNSATCEVHAGDRIAITGPSGSGKSTLLNLMADVEQPTAGEISWPGLPQVPARGQVGVVLQGPTLVPALSVAENAALPLVLAGVPKERAHRRALHCLAVVAAAELAHKMPSELSGGQASHVAIARTLATSPRLILADDPTGDLDRATGRRVIDVLFAAADEAGAALVVTTRDPAVAERLRKRWAMHEGCLHLSPRPPAPAKAAPKAPELSLPDADAESTAQYVVRKLPEVTLAFWIMKIAATTLGETAGDLFAQTLRLGYFLTTIALFLMFVVTLLVQLRAKHYNPFFYWPVIVSTSMVGTTVSDFMNRDASSKYLAKGATSLGWGPQGLGLGYPAGAAILISLLIAIFVVWKFTGQTFVIRDIVTFRGEALFWSAILVSNTLGTSMGDFLSDSSGLGYAGSALLITGALLVLVALIRVPFVPNVVLFWIAFVLTRPLGATAGDFLTKPTAKGGLDLGTVGSSAVLLTALFALMAYGHFRDRARGRQAPGNISRAVH
ncbi:ATP-binding cassette domain-containing protein [Streptomyces goshikiensis]|uniref:ATP-binding cassette domain-containing protein n=1 Tax=Streptomyces goshikiensis TaxID=1942 RepID=UPI003693B362